MATSGFFERLNHFANFERQFLAYALLHFAVYAEFVAVAASEECLSLNGLLCETLQIQGEQLCPSYFGHRGVWRRSELAL